MISRAAVLLILTLAASVPGARQQASPKPAGPIFGFRDAATERAREREFLAVPDPQLARQHLQTLTKAPHLAGTPEDKATAEYVAARFREAGLDTQIVEYKVPLNYPAEIRITITTPDGKEFTAPAPERVSDDPYQNDPRIVGAYSGYSPSGDVEGEAVYANYGRPEDFARLQQLNVDVRGKIVVVRYGQNFRGVKALVAQEHGAAGVIIYSDPYDDGYYKGDAYPKGPWRPESAVQRGSIGYMFEFPGDPETPGVASTPDLPDSQRKPMAESPEMPKIPTTALSWGDARPILEAMGGPESPRAWQGALPFTYHVGAGPVRVKLHLKQNYALRTIWDVIGTARGSDLPEQWVVGGNHRDAWVYGAVDPNSGTAAMLETVHGIGKLLKSGWRPKRTIVFASWDAEEFGLIGSTEWAEQHAADLEHAAAYFNMDVAVAGPNFTASAVPSLQDFVREITRAVPSPQGATVYDVWSTHREEEPVPAREVPSNRPAAPTIGDLGSGSDFTPFLQHLGVPATDIGSGGSYGVYHSAFDNFAWFTKFADPTFVYEQQMARVFGLEMMRMASADVLPYDYEAYGKAIEGYLKTAQQKSQEAFGAKSPSFAEALAAAARLAQAGAQTMAAQKDGHADAAKLNGALLAAERGLLAPQGLPGRPWYHHVIYAPGRYTGYAAAVLPGVNEAIDAHDLAATEGQLQVLRICLEHVASTLEAAR
ncbi:MAG TPA: M28 family metallopeptidase [Terriglobales bacterium]|nr:M28 family metallopeptidase [Terriglobales bacterium]